MEINKTLLLAGAAFVVAGVLVFGILNRVYKNKIGRIENSYTAQITQIEDQRDAAKAHADSVDFMYSRHKIEMDSISKIEARLRWENEQFKVELTNAWHIIFDATEDENYTSLQIQYPTEDTLKYPFSGEQVKGIALDLVRLNFMDSLYNNQLEISKLLEIQLEKSNHMVDKLNVERQDLEFLNDKIYTQLAAKTEELRVTEEEVAELKKKLRIRTAGGVGGVLLAGAALLILL